MFFVLVCQLLQHTLSYHVGPKQREAFHSEVFSYKVFDCRFRQQKQFEDVNLSPRNIQRTVVTIL